MCFAPYNGGGASSFLQAGRCFTALLTLARQ
nr:MAG TPA: hypothetical protein [Caudoviricetes sp.]